MSEQLKRWALRLYNDCGGYSPEMVDPQTLPDPASRTAYVLEADAGAALAAKDARIAELEEHCKRLGAGDAERYWEGRWRDADAELSRLRDAATPSEDGGEVPEVVAHRPRPVLFSSDGELLMTVAQHSRIVAAKDAEIARLCKLAYIGEHHFEDCTYKFRLEELRAQPARNEVVIDLDALAWESIKEAANNSPWMPEQYMLNDWVADVCAFLREPARQVGGDERESCAICDGTGKDGSYDCGACKGKGYIEFPLVAAALAPAAVVMPERKSETAPPPFERGYNAALDAVARLNRRVIPVELLKKQYDRIDYAAAMNDTHAVKALTNELRALLGKD